MSLNTLLMFLAVISFFLAIFWSWPPVPDRPWFRLNPIAVGLFFWAASVLLTGQ